MNADRHVYGKNMTCRIFVGLKHCLNEKFVEHLM